MEAQLRAAKKRRVEIEQEYVDVRAEELNERHLLMFRCDAERLCKRCPDKASLVEGTVESTLEVEGEFAMRGFTARDTSDWHFEHDEDSVCMLTFVPLDASNESVIQLDIDSLFDVQPYQLVHEAEKRNEAMLTFTGDYDSHAYRVDIAVTQSFVLVRFK